MKKLYLTKKSELITPSSKITPPPPPRLNKALQFKYLLELSINYLALLSISIMLATVSCGNEDTSSTTPSLISLTYSAPTINAAEGNAITAITPTIVPKDAMVNYTVSPQLPAGLELNPKSGTISGTPTDAYAAEAVYTVTATGTEGYTGSATAAITIAVGTLSRNIVVTETAKTNSEKDRRYHYVVFTVKADGTTSMGRHKFALKLKTETAPAVQEMNDGAGVYRIVDSAAKKILLSYSLSSGIRALATNSNYLGSAVKNGDTVGGEVVDIDSYLLTPDTAYTLYALKDGGSSVMTIKDFNTDTFDPDNTPLTDGYVNDPAMSGDYFYDASDVIFVLPVSLFSTRSPTYALEEPNEPPHVVYSITFGEPDPMQISNGVAVLIPSHFTDGGKGYRTMGGKKVIGVFTILPSTLFPDKGSYSVRVESRVPPDSPINITFHPDR